MTAARRYLLVFLLLLSQCLLSMHLISHAVDGDDGLSGEVCQLCVHGGQLGQALTAAPRALPEAQATHVLTITAPTGRNQWPTPAARQGAPPHFPY